MKLKLSFRGLLYSKSLSKLFLIMRLSLLLTVVTILNTYANVFSQNAKINVTAENISIKELLRDVESKSGYAFFFNDNHIELNKHISFKTDEIEVEQLLEKVLKGTNLSYKIIEDKLIVIVKNSDSQEITIKGTVLDYEGNPLPGVNILEKGTTNGGVTDIDGNFIISVSSTDAILVFSYVGFLSEEVEVANQTTINVTMIEDIQAMDEVVVIGYGAVKKSDLTGSVSQVKTEELETVPVYSMEQALKSRAAGIRVTQNSGEPGGRIEVRVRGGNSMIGGNSPLYVVDGFAITGGIDFLNPSDIESIDILKDASATAIYGSRGANGVVIITSKRGKEGQDGRIEINSFYGVQTETKRYEMLDAKQYAEVANERLINDGGEAYFNIDDVENPGTDWQDYIFRKAPIHNHTITFSGSSESTRYSLSTNYYSQEGIIKRSGVKKGSMRLNLDHDVTKWLKLGVNLNLSRRFKERIDVNNGSYGTNILSAALAAPPTLPVYDEDGQFTRIESIYSFGSADMRNPLLYAQGKDQYVNNSIIGNTTLEIKLAEGLSFKALLGLEYDGYLRETYSPIIFENDRGAASEGYSYRNSFLNENTLNFAKTFGMHSINLVTGFTYQTNMNRFHSISVSGFPNNTTENYNLNTAETVNFPTSGITEWALASWLGRANYTLMEKYIVTASIRADGSSRFGASNKWGYFPSGAFAWRISEEPFMENVPVISYLKLRTSYGITGNTGLSPYQSLDRLSSTKYIFGESEVTGYVPSGIANSDLKWETTAQFDIGFDLNFIDNRLRFTADYYQKHTTDLLASVPLPPSIGFSSITQNIGEIKNKGLEFSAQADIITKGDLNWSVATTFSTNRNEVVKLADGADIYGNSIKIPFYSSINIAREGEPFGMFYGLVEDGLNDEGYIKYVDQNEDGEINNLDRVILGNPYPDFIYGFNTDFSYKNFDLNIFFEGVQGNDIFWATAGTHLNSFQRGTNQFADLYGNYWTEANPDPNAKYPKISSSTAVTVSDRFIKDGSYLRLKSIKLAYNLSGAKLGASWFRSAQIYVSGTNLLTFTSYPGLDPEVNTRGSDDTSVGSRLLIGVDESAYPNAKTYAVGVKFNF